MFYIEQEEGKLVDAAHECWQAVKDGNMETAKRIYRQFVGEPPTDNEVWWRFNAPSSIRCASRLTTTDYAKFHGTSKQCAYQAARLAERKVGGKWQVVYEY